MGTLRVAFLSGTVLELAATLGIALVAVTVGVRLVGGRSRLRGRPHRARARAGALPAAAQPRGPVPRERRRARRRRAPPRSARGAAGRPRPGRITPPSPRDAPVRLEGVSFAYPTREGVVLDSIDLELAPGETVALVGPSGSGKSTIASLLLRLVGADGGRTVGAVDLAACDAAAWRAQIAWVPQRPTLFRGTVAENIRLGDRRRRRARAGGGGAGRSRCLRPRAARTGTRPSSATAGARSRPASSSGSRSRERSCATRRSSSSTSPRRTSTPRAPSSSARPSSGCAKDAPSSSSRTAPSWLGARTASSRSRRGGSSRPCGGGCVMQHARSGSLALGASAVARGALGRARRAGRLLRRRPHDDGRLPDLARRPSSRRSSP